LAEETEAGSRKTNVFISYSRRDAEIADRLHEKLTAEGLNPYLDKHDIAAGEDWKSRLGGLIEAADTMVFLVSPDSIASKVCDWEINHAELKGKRILPVVCREAAEDEVPERLRRLNYVFMRNGEEEIAALPRLAEALAVDIAWIRNHTRYGELAGEWDARKRPSSLLLRGARIGEAEQWRDSRPPTAPQLTEVQSAFIAASRRGASNRQRGWVAGSLVVAIAAIGLSVFAVLQQQAAEASRKETTQVLATSDFRLGSDLADDPETAADGIAYLSRAARSGDNRAERRLWTMLQQRSFWVPASATAAPVTPPPAATIPEDVAARFASVDFDGQHMAPSSIAISGDGQRVFTAAGNPTEMIPIKIKVWTRDGVAITDWWEPPYRGDIYLSEVSGHLSQDGKFLAVEMLGWRETAYLVVYDLERMVELGADIVASGLLPQAQSQPFTSVQFVEREAIGDAEARLYLFAAAAKGDAAVYELSGDEFYEIGRNRHRAPVSTASLDAGQTWLMSAAGDRTVRVSTLHTGESVGNLLFAEQPVAALSGDGQGILTLVAADGSNAGYSLKAPVKRTISPRPKPAESDAAHQEACLRPNDRYADPVTTLAHPSGLTLTMEPGRRVGVAAAGLPKAVSPAFVSDIEVVCASADGKLVAVTTTDFRTEIWTADFAGRVGQPLDEKRRFGDGLTPDKTDWVQLSADGRTALVRSSFWDPPNVDYFWLNVWDIDSGLPLIDRVQMADDGLTDGVIRSATLDQQSGHLIYIGDAAMVPQSIEVAPPAQVAALLPQYSEAIAGQTIDSEGIAVAVPDRAERLAAGVPLPAADQN